MIYIDGSYGEGGGQVLRTSLSLAAITGQPIHIDNIRAKRKKPGLAAQHLTAVRAAAEICGAQMWGDALGSMSLEFTPTAPVTAGKYTFDVTEAMQGGSAGAITLVLQTVLLPLSLASGNSQVILRGGTHVAFSPPFTYIQQVYLPILQQMGVEAEANLNAWGWYPRGGGEVVLRVSGDRILNSINLMNRGKLKKLHGIAIVTELPSDISQRMANRAENLLQKAEISRDSGHYVSIKVQPLREKGIGPGAGIFLTAEYENSRTCVGALGRLGLPADKVADLAYQELLKFHKTGAAVDEHLADQLILPAVLADGNSQYQVAEVSEHLRTNAWVVEQFGLAKLTIDEINKIVTVEKQAGS